MTELTVNQAKLISLGMEVGRMKRLADNSPKFMEKTFCNALSKAIDAYFVVWFEINREKVEEKRIEKRLERGDTEKESILSLSSHQFQEYAFERCVEGLDL